MASGDILIDPTTLLSSKAHLTIDNIGTRNLVVIYVFLGAVDM